MKSGFSPLLFAAFAAGLFSSGCEDADPKAGVSWNGAAKPATQQEQPAETEESAESATGTDGTGEGATDEVPFSSLNWVYGGVNGGTARPSTVTIAGLALRGRTLSFRYVVDLAVWRDLSPRYAVASDTPALACLFVKNNAGRWVGGKFDWIGSSRNTRPLGNVADPGPNGKAYGGWTLAGVPNPCECAFVIVSSDGKRRSNVLYATWAW